MPKNAKSFPKQKIKKWSRIEGVITRKVGAALAVSRATLATVKAHRHLAAQVEKIALQERKRKSKITSKGASKVLLS